MIDPSQLKWRRLNGNPLTDSLINHVEDTIQNEIKQGHKLKVCIGTDSQIHGDRVDFASVIVFLREKKGGFMFIHTDTKPNRMSLKERMIDEVSLSVQIAYHLCALLDKYKVELEVHADINTDPNFESNVALKEAMGYILGMGFKFKAKPDAFASSSCADKLI